jgi:hypothetical protein
MKRFFHMPPQVLRILLLAVGIVVIYSIARYFLTPASFGQYGWYRGEALAEMASHEPLFGGKEACQECHSDEYQKVAKHEHKTLSCEGCHGPGGAHAQNPDVKVERKPEFGQCVRCHEANVSRPKWHKQIVSKSHYPGSKCTECHVPHAPSEVP